MTRVLCWNIRDFGVNKLANPDTKHKQPGSGLRKAEAALERCSYVEEVIAAAAADVVVVVEATTNSDPRGRLAVGAGADGCIELMSNIRATYNDSDWHLVPPIRTGPTETVGVLYRSAQRYFAGPNRWPGGAAAVTAPPPAAPGQYPRKFKLRLPNRVVPGGALQNANSLERTSAARVEFTYRAGHANAGAPIDWGKTRAPFMVSFAETDNADPPSVLRNLTLFAIHAPASFAADSYLRDLADVSEIYAPLGNDEVRLVIGDFNVNLLNPDVTEAGPYAPLCTHASYELALPAMTPPPADRTGYQGYYATHILPRRSASCWSIKGRAVHYPGYEYIGSERKENFYAIDNAYRRYGANVPKVDSKFTILNAVVGSPFLVAPAKPGYGAGPPGTRAMPRLLSLPPPPPPADPPAQGPPHSKGLRNSFRGWAQYACISNTSDHLAIVLEV